MDVAGCPLRHGTAASGTSAAVPVSATAEKKEDEQYDDYGSHVIHPFWFESHDPRCEHACADRSPSNRLLRSS
jgi:hypothetical protein